MLDLSVKECQCKSRKGQDIYQRLQLDPNTKIEELYETNRTNLNDSNEEAAYNQYVDQFNQLNDSIEEIDLQHA